MIASTHYENTLPRQRDRQSYFSIDFELSAFKNFQHSLVQILL